MLCTHKYTFKPQVYIYKCSLTYIFLFFVPPSFTQWLAGEKIFQQAREQVETAGISVYTGLHDPDVAEPPPLTPNTIAKATTYTDEMLGKI